ncbi:MAG: efflux RND transporter periplasmic adaptor subunit [Deltaproteobacteria bacterium]|nr:efflux RND transporter periplasmic adaptor subunit [Deltaproteobacteria bacterium]
MFLRVLGLVSALVFLLLVGMYQSGFFVEKINSELVETGNYLSDKFIKETYLLSEEVIPVYYRAAATVHSRDDVDISSRIMARTLTINVREGDAVTKGQLLVKLDDKDLNAQYERAQMVKNAAKSNFEAAKAAVTGAESDFETIKKDYTRMKNLLAGKAISQSAFDNIEGQYNSAKAGLTQAQNKLEQAESGVKEAEQAVIGALTIKEYTELRSPIDGVVYERRSDPGDLAVAGQPVLKIFDPEKLMVEAAVSEKYIEKVEIGQQVKVHISAVKKNFFGEVREIVPYVDSQTRTFLIKICLGAESFVKPGMYGTAMLLTGQKRAVLIDEKYITRSGQIEYVWIKKEGHNDYLKTCIHTVKDQNSAKLKVLSGINSGEIIGLVKTER